MKTYTRAPDLNSDYLKELSDRSMDNHIRISIFKDSRRPFIELLEQHQVAFEAQTLPMGAVVASGGLLEVLKELAGPLASVIVAFISGRPSRKVIITLKDHTVVNAENYSAKEVETLLKAARSVAAIETKPDDQ